MQVILHSEPTHPAVITVPVWSEQAEGETDEQFLSRVIAHDIPPAATGVQVIDEAAIPADAYETVEGVRRFSAFRDALKLDLTFDMPKAREIVREKIRHAREPLLRALDVEYMRADEIGDTAAKQDIARRKQVLRDAPANPAIEAATTIAVLRSLMELS